MDERSNQQDLVAARAAGAELAVEQLEAAAQLAGNRKGRCGLLLTWLRKHGRGAGEGAEHSEPGKHGRPPS